MSKSSGREVIRNRKEDELISVIVPFYNVEQYIEQTLESIINQEYKEIELVLIDDGSTDKSCERTLEMLSRKPFRHILHRQENRGVSAARNKGIELASGTYLIFVDSDDLMHPRYVKQLHDAMVQKKLDIIFCGFKRFKNGLKYMKQPSPTIKVEKMGQLDMMRDFLYGSKKLSICAMMISKKNITANSLLFYEGYRYAEDIHFIWRALLYTERIGYDPSCLYFYRFRSGSAMAGFEVSRSDGLFLMKDIEKNVKSRCTSFYEEYSMYGSARWVWSTLWQAAFSLPYPEFKKTCSQLDSEMMLKRLFSYPNYMVRISSRVCIFSNRMYYFLIKMFCNARGLYYGFLAWLNMI